MELKDIFSPPELEKVELSLHNYRRFSRLYIDIISFKEGVLKVKASQRENHQQKYLSKEEIGNRVREVFNVGNNNIYKIEIESHPYKPKKEITYFLHEVPELIIERRKEPTFRARIIEGTKEDSVSFEYNGRSYYLEAIGKEVSRSKLGSAARQAKSAMKLKRMP